MEIARAAASRPRVILLDEPFSGLNPTESRLLSQALASLNRAQGIAMVLVEHDVEIVFGLSERVFVLDFGVIIAAGTPAEMRRDPAVRAAYLGDLSDGSDPALDTGTEKTPASRTALTVRLAARPSPAGPRRQAGAAVERRPATVSGLCLKYADATALEQVSFTVAPGSVTALLGANGAGKSSVARAVSGLVRRSRA